jgi:hypothetical protein
MIFPLPFSLENYDVLARHAKQAKIWPEFFKVTPTRHLSSFERSKTGSEHLVPSSLQ